MTAKEKKIVKVLKSALVGMLVVCEEYAAEYIKHERACDWGKVNEAYMARTTALKQAEEAGM